MKHTMIISIVIAALLFGIGGFIGGMKYQQSKRSSFAGQFGNGAQGGRFGGPNGGGNRQGIRPVAGIIAKSDETSITVKLQDGTSRVVLISDKTTVNKSAQTTIADLVTGEQVAVFGTENSDGSVTAQNIQLGAMFRGSMTGTPSSTPVQ